MGAIGHQGNTDFYMNPAMSQGSYNVQGGNQQMYLSVGPQLGKGTNKGVLQGSQTHQRHVSLSGNNRTSSMSGQSGPQNNAVFSGHRQLTNDTIS